MEITLEIPANNEQEAQLIGDSLTDLAYLMNCQDLVATVALMTEYPKVVPAIRDIIVKAAESGKPPNPIAVMKLFTSILTNPK